jgi:hypothetical protein
MDFEATTQAAAAVVEYCVEDMIVEDHMAEDMADLGAAADSNVAVVGEYKAVAGMVVVELEVFPVVLHIVV